MIAIRLRALGQTAWCAKVGTRPSSWWLSPESSQNWSPEHFGSLTGILRLGSSR
jgi:hypothetical protein